MPYNGGGVALKALFEHGVELVLLLVDEATGIGKKDGFRFGGWEFDLLPLLVLGKALFWEFFI